MWLWVPISLVLSACHWLEFCRNSIKAFNLVAPNIFHSRQFLFFECSIVDSCHEKRLDYKTRFDRNRSEFSTLISPYALVATYPAKLKKNINHCMFSFAGVMADSKLSQQGFFLHFLFERIFNYYCWPGAQWTNWLNLDCSPGHGLKLAIHSEKWSPEATTSS